MNAASIVSKVWGFCTTLRDDGVGYGDYLERLAYLIFLKMVEEYSKLPITAVYTLPPNITGQALSPEANSLDTA